MKSNKNKDKDREKSKNKEGDTSSKLRYCATAAVIEEPLSVLREI